jgi:hypothetical protein
VTKSMLRGETFYSCDLLIFKLAVSLMICQ